MSGSSVNAAIAVPAARAVSDANTAFWDEMCGTTRAQMLGITDASPASLKKFDDWYFGFYPFLFDHIPFAQLKNKDVLEVGLGYGTVAQKLAESGANYQGLDIASGPVALVNHRLQQAGLPGQATQGSILTPPFKAESFDAIVTIGCLHHTGDVQAALDRCWDLLRPSGQLIVMVYYAYSYKRLIKNPLPSLRYALREARGYRGVVGASEANERADFDLDSAGGTAPHTDWVSIPSLHAMCHRFTSFNAALENIHIEKLPPALRLKLQSTFLAHWFGLNVYATAVK